MVIFSFLFSFTFVLNKLQASSTKLFTSGFFSVCILLIHFSRCWVAGCCSQFSFTFFPSLDVFGLTILLYVLEPRKKRNYLCTIAYGFFLYINKYIISSLWEFEYINSEQKVSQLPNKNKKSFTTLSHRLFHFMPFLPYSVKFFCFLFSHSIFNRLLLLISFSKTYYWYSHRILKYIPLLQKKIVDINFPKILFDRFHALIQKQFICDLTLNSGKNLSEHFVDKFFIDSIFSK